jgi:hypothetical protein
MVQYSGLNLHSTTPICSACATRAVVRTAVLPHFTKFVSLSPVEAVCFLDRGCSRRSGAGGVWT